MLPFHDNESRPSYDAVSEIQQFSAELPVTEIDSYPPQNIVQVVVKPISVPTDQVQLLKAVIAVYNSQVSVMNVAEVFKISPEEVMVIIKAMPKGLNPDEITQTSQLERAARVLIGNVKSVYTLEELRNAILLKATGNTTDKAIFNKYGVSDSLLRKKMSKLRKFLEVDRDGLHSLMVQDPQRIAIAITEVIDVNLKRGREHYLNDTEANKASKLTSESTTSEICDNQNLLAQVGTQNDTKFLKSIGEAAENQQKRDEAVVKNQAILESFFTSFDQSTNSSNPDGWKVTPIRFLKVVYRIMLNGSVGVKVSEIKKEGLVAVLEPMLAKRRLQGTEQQGLEAIPLQLLDEVLSDDSGDSKNGD